MAKMTESIVVALRAAFHQWRRGHGPELNHTAFAEAWRNEHAPNVSVAAVLNAAFGVSWKHLPNAVPAPGQHGRRRYGARQDRRKLTPREVRAIRDEHADGTSMSQIARDRGLAKHHVQLIVKRKIWKDVL